MTTEIGSEAWRKELATSDRAQAQLRELVARAVRKAMARSGALDEATLEDLTQVATLRVLDRLDRFEGRSKFSTWVYSVAVRAALSELRRSAYKSSGESLAEESEAIPAQDEAPTTRAEQEEIVEAMHRVIAEHLTDRQRTAILGELAGTPQEELLATLGIQRNALYKLLHDARKNLKRGLLQAGIHDTQVRSAFDL